MAGPSWVSLLGDSTQSRLLQGVVLLRLARQVWGQVPVSELLAGGDADLPEDIPKVPFDRARTEVEPAADLPIGEACLGELGDLQLLDGQSGGRVVQVPTYPALRRGRNLSTCSVGEALK